MNDRIYWAITSVCVGVTITVSIMFVAVSIPAEVHATDGPMETRTLCFERETFDFDFPVGIVQTHWGDDLWRQMPVTVSSPRFAVTDAVIDSLFDVLDERMSGMSDLEKANALHDFVYRNVDYRHDSVQFGCSEYVQYPSETLYNGKGDCEDSALLLHVLYDKAGLDKGRDEQEEYDRGYRLCSACALKYVTAPECGKVDKYRGDKIRAPAEKAAHKVAPHSALELAHFY